MKFELTAHYLDTAFLPSFWGILNRLPQTFRKDLSITERLKVFFKTHPDVITEDITALQALMDQIDEKSKWFLGGSDEKSSLIACALQRSDQGYSLTQNQFLKHADAVITLGHLKPPKSLHRFDLRSLQLTYQQKILLSLMGAHALLTSSYFNCQTVALVNEVSIHSICKTG
jgi:hypothetical protein